MGEVGDGPVVTDGEAPYRVAKVIISAPQSLDALGSREAGIRRELGPGSVSFCRHNGLRMRERRVRSSSMQENQHQSHQYTRHSG